jgi:lipopolysaccharide export system protein LptA
VEVSVWYFIMYKHIKKFACFLFWSIVLQNGFAQVKPAQITIERADALIGERHKNNDVKKLIGQVILGHEGALMYCDSAWFYDVTNSADCFGNVRIVKGDSLQMSGNFLRYNGNTRLARIVKDVMLTDGKMILHTDTLDYNRNTEVASYNTGADITDNNNQLVSQSGYYFIKEKTFYFKNNVVLNNPKYYLNTDTLKYNTIIKVANFFGPTSIYSKTGDSTFMYCQTGWYNTISDKSYFGYKASIQSKTQCLFADSILYDKRLGIGEAFKNVIIADSVQGSFLTGDKGWMHEKQNQSFITGSATLIQAMDTDSLYLHADTLFATYDTITKTKLYQAYHGVRIYKSDLQGRCDSLIFNTTDSIMRFYAQPILWSNQSQLTATHITMQMANKKIGTMQLLQTAFIINVSDSLQYNQIKGKDMVGYFIDNKLRKIDVTGNGQTVYYPKNKENKTIGANRVECTDMVIFIDSNQIKNITFINKPEGTMFPIKEVKPIDFTLKGFKWLIHLQPKRKEDIYLD